MKKFLLIISILFLLASPATKADEGWVINNFESYIRVQEDGKVKIEETIDVDFRGLEKHGIFRDIPYVYQSSDRGKIYTEVKIAEIADGNSNISYKIIRNKSNLRIRIGDPNKTVSGKQRYKIDYLVSGVLATYAEFDELYWNATGLDWPVSIQKSSAQVILPQDGVIQSSCYIGRLGSEAGCLKEKVSDKEIRFFSSRSLKSGEGLTVTVGYTKGMVPVLKVASPKTLSDVLFSFWTIFSFVVTALVGIFLVLKLWWRRGRDLWWRRKSLHDPKKSDEIMPLGMHETISAEYESPEGLRPAEVGVLMDERADTIDVSATIVDLAVRGYLTITEEEKKWKFGKMDYLLTKTGKEPAGLLEYEEMLLSSLFDGRGKVRLSELKNTFYNNLAEVKKALYKEVVRKKLFVKNPKTVRLKYNTLAVLITAAGIIMATRATSSLDGNILGAGLGLAAVGIVFIFFGYSMPKKTAFGREVYRKARGYRLFVSGTEKYRQPYFENRNIFMGVLPHAIVFGVTKKLAKAMKQMGIEPPQPTWYYGVGAFNIAAFGSSIDSFSKSLSSAIASVPSGSGSGGGGFSGGGFGGGGGGSW